MDDLVLIQIDKTHLVTALIFTPKTPDCFREGIRFRLNSLLLNFMESFTSICNRDGQILLLRGCFNVSI